MHHSLPEFLKALDAHGHPLSTDRQRLKRRTLLWAMAQAGLLVGSLGTGPMAALAKDEPRSPTGARVKADKTYACDVLVIGAGSAGMSAAIEAHRHGAHVMVIEKMGIPGGNTWLACDTVMGIGADTDPNVSAKAIEKDRQQIGAAMLKLGQTCNPLLLEKVVNQSGEAVKWLRSLGIDLSVGSKYSRKCQTNCLFKPKNSLPVGREVMRGLLMALDIAQIPLLTSVTANEFIKNSKGRVTGIKAFNATTNERLIINAKSIVLATGGFASNIDLLHLYNPDLPALLSASSPGAVGDGLIMALAIRAKTTDLDAVMYNATSQYLTGMPFPYTYRRDGAILVNRTGVRFVNETLSTDEVTHAILAQPGGFAWLLFDQVIALRHDSLDDQANTGILVMDATQNGLARAIDVDLNNFIETLRLYRNQVRERRDEDFGRTEFNSDLSSRPLYAVKVRPGFMSTPGGLVITEKGELLGQNLKVIEGVFAAGEVTGGIDGRMGIVSNGIPTAVIFGRSAGESAAQHAKTMTGKLKGTYLDRRQLPH